MLRLGVSFYTFEGQSALRSGVSFLTFWGLGSVTFGG